MDVKKFLALVSVCWVAVLTGCSSSSRGVPEWYLTPPSGGNGLYGAGSNQAKSAKLAKQLADSAGCHEIAKALSGRVGDLTRLYLGQNTGVGSGQARLALGDAAKAIAERNPSGCENVRRDVRSLPDGSTEVFSLEYLGPAGALAATRAARDAQPAFARSGETFEELDKILAREIQVPAGN
jgi:hypothetical protein